MLEKLSVQTPLDTSPHLESTWTVKYAGPYAPGPLPSPAQALGVFLTTGASPANTLSTIVNGFWGRTLGLTLGSKKIRISNGNKVDAKADIKTPTGKETLRYKAELARVGTRRLEETIYAVKLPGP